MKNNKKTYFLIFVISLLFILFIFSVIFSVITIPRNTIIDGIYIEGIDVSGLSKEDANNLISEKCDEKSSSNFDVIFVKNNGQKNEFISSNSILTLDIKYNVSQAIDNAYSVGRNKNIFENNFDILKTLIHKKNIEVDFSVDDNNFEQLIDKIISEIPDKLVESSYYIENNNLVILPGSKGYIANKDDLKNSVITLIKEINNNENVINLNIYEESPKEISIEKIHDEIYKTAQNAYFEKEPFKVFKEVYGIDFDIELAKNILSEHKEEYVIPLIVTEPEITVNNLEIDIFPDLLSTFSTRYDSQNKNRENNINLATSKINELILAPGEEFSYNTVVGARNIASGYKEAKIYSNGQVVDGIGGGICQVSSTLYNTAMFANLDIKERHSHQFITSYIEPGRDATVVYGSKDLKFVNNRNYPIKIIATAGNGNVKISIYGIKENLEYDVSFDNEIVDTIEYSTKYYYNSNLNSSEQNVKQLGANGAIVNDYKVVKLNGAIVSRTLISQDKYSALNKIIETGNYDEINNDEE